MPRKISLSSNEKKLTRRYLVWCYKTTKEELDRIDRYYTQLVVDQILLEHLSRGEDFKRGKEEYKTLVKDFKDYMGKKKENVDLKKYQDPIKKVLNPQYVYLKNRFDAIEKAIVHFLGAKELEKITLGYEQEMTRRIFEAREHS